MPKKLSRFDEAPVVFEQADANAGRCPRLDDREGGS